MSWVMFRQALKDLRWTVFWYSLGVFLYGLMILSFYPTVRDTTEPLQQYMDVFPQAFIEAFGVSDMASLEGFIGGEFLNLIWPLIASIFLIMAGTATVAREVERGTIELLLSVPRSRTRLLMGKVVALLIGTAVFAAATLGSLVLGVLLVDETLEFRNLAALSVELAAFAVAVGGYSVLFSSFSKERGKAAGIAAGLTLAFYLAWVISGLSEDWEWLENVTIFTAFDPQGALASGEPDLAQLGILLAIGVVATLAALVIFRWRDAISS